MATYFYIEKPCKLLRIVAMDPWRSSRPQFRNVGLSERDRQREMKERDCLFALHVIQKAKRISNN